jgi:hypothetical protein
MVERGVSRPEVEEAIQRGTKRRQGSRFVAAHRYFEVVFRKDGDDVIVITVMPRW